MIMAGDGVQPHRMSSSPPRVHIILARECDCQQCQSERYLAWVATNKITDKDEE